MPDPLACDPADAATLAALRRLAAVPPPRPAFVRALKEELMTGPMSRRTPLAPVASWSAPRPPLLAVAPVGGGSRIRRLNTLATAALLLVAATAIMLAVVHRGDGDGAPSTVPALAAATPDAAPGILEPCRSFLGCPGAIGMVWPGTAYAWGVDLYSLGARDVQLQGWMLDPGATLAHPATADGEPQGAVVDFVVSGTYLATFDVPVSVNYLAGESGNILPRYIEAGTPVELGRGETVSYSLGGLTELSNPLSQRDLHFKRAIVYTGDVTATHVTGVAGVTMRVDGDGQLRQPVLPGFGITLMFVNIPPGVAFPPEPWADTVVIGPVNAETAPEGSQGYVLRIGAPMG